MLFRVNKEDNKHNEPPAPMETFSVLRNVLSLAITTDKVRFKVLHLSVPGSHSNSLCLPQRLAVGFAQQEHCRITEDCDRRVKSRNVTPDLGELFTTQE